MNTDDTKTRIPCVCVRGPDGVTRAGDPLALWGRARGGCAGSKPSWRVWGCLALVCLFAGRGAGQGIPEPDLVMYGAVLNVTSNANLRLGYGALTWVFQPVGGGPAITASGTLTNINNQFSYILRIPCETPVPGFSVSSNTIQLSSTSITYDRSQVRWNTNLLAFAQPSLSTTTFSATDRGRIERVDLTVSVPIVIDFNGFPVDWELSYFGRTGIDANADPDGDGLSNFAEYRAGTAPNEPGSGLRFTKLTPVQGGIQLQWLSASYKTYAVQRSTSPAGSYLDFQTGITATAPTNTWLDATALGTERYYYRLRLDDALSVPTAPSMRFVSIRADVQGGIRVDWLSAPDQVYALQRSSNLSAGFVDLATGIAATPPSNSYRDATATGRGPYFYRLRLDNGAVSPPATFKFVNIQADPLGGLHLGWLSVTNQSYTLQRSSNLKTGFADISTSLVATPPTNSFRDSNATGSGPYYYRLVLEP
jgi:hypothetical protein